MLHKKNASFRSIIRRSLGGATQAADAVVASANPLPYRFAIADGVNRNAGFTA